jgi:hypothetical protein
MQKLSTAIVLSCSMVLKTEPTSGTFAASMLGVVSIVVLSLQPYENPGKSGTTGIIPKEGL